LTLAAQTFAGSANRLSAKDELDESCVAIVKTAQQGLVPQDRWNPAERIKVGHGQEGIHNWQALGKVTVFAVV